MERSTNGRFGSLDGSLVHKKVFVVNRRLPSEEPGRLFRAIFYGWRPFNFLLILSCHFPTRRARFETSVSMLSFIRAPYTIWYVKLGCVKCLVICKFGRKSSPLYLTRYVIKKGRGGSSAGQHLSMLCRALGTRGIYLLRNHSIITPRIP